ncbi:hypothetical protein WOLCODRAFT_139325 [Wolfiporia cocos MD-104 SS10]|uniref:Uncharacterized protein n=1 Tax=Wolfiporia cocos (strain MD-104) TaxID=742152 RepID=A0A2H3JY63_WOLCO|nr:hypothetical protein WOLCODRAFT_139325 [Wolfiporia cocos MD-104 SS10]
MPGTAISTPQKVLSAIHNIPKRMKSSQLRSQERPRGKENVPPGEQSSGLCALAILVTSPSCPAADQSATLPWQPKDGMIIIKVAVPCTDDLWKLRVPEDISLDDFLARVEHKVGFPVEFTYRISRTREHPVKTEVAFKTWVAGRVRKGKNTHLIAHVPL